MLFRRKELPWEVVFSRGVDPVPVYYEDEDLYLVSMKKCNVCRTYVLDVTNSKGMQDICRAVVFAREQLLQEVNDNGYNMLVLESWRVTLLRKAKLHRVEVEYSGRPAISSNKVTVKEDPPFMAILQNCIA